MSLTMSEYVVEDLLREAFVRLPQNIDTIVNDTFAFLSDTRREEIRTFLASYPITVRQVWPARAADVPCVIVQLRPASERANMQPLSPADQYQDGDAIVTQYLTYFQVTIQCVCYGQTVNQARYLGAIVEYYLLLFRRHLDGSGLMEQSLLVSDYEPVAPPGDDSDGNGFWYMRTVTLNATVEESVLVREGPILAEILLSVQDSGSN